MQKVGDAMVIRDILLRSYNYCRNRLDGDCAYLMQEKDESGTEYKCAYYGNHRCKNGMLDDAIELLKEQEAVEPILKREGRNKYYNYYVCPRCNEDVVYDQNYCSECGAKFIWEGR